MSSHGLEMASAESPQGAYPRNSIGRVDKNNGKRAAQSPAQSTLTICLAIPATYYMGTDLELYTFNNRSIHTTAPLNVRYLQASNRQIPS